MSESFQFTEVGHSSGRNERRPDAIEIQGQPLDESFVVVAAFLEMILKGFANALQHLLQNRVKPGEFVGASLEVAGRFLLQTEWSFPARIGRHNSVSFQFL